MANEEEEELVILEADDGDDSNDEIVDLVLEGEDDPLSDELERLKEKEEVQEGGEKSKKLLYIGLGIGILFLLIMIAVILFFASSKEDKSQNIDTKGIVEKIQKKDKGAKFSPSKVENMLKRANALYERGRKVEALNIYESIANFNESLSNYNMGVAQMKEKSFKDAINSFKRAILNQENRTVSAINAAVCALQLRDKTLFNYYLELAYTYLPEESNSSLYSYYVGLINFYRGNYYEALSAFAHSSSAHYKDRQAYVASKIYTFLEKPNLALNALQAYQTTNDIFSEGLLYANIGEYKIAKNRLEKSIKDGIETKRSKLALALVNMKLGNFEDAGTALRENFEADENLTKNAYPIKAILSPTFFNVHKAQSKFQESLFFAKPKQYAMLFYFAPYKVFNAKQTMEIIRKGGINVFLDDTDTALKYLHTSSTMSKVNVLMSEAIKKALNHRVLQANVAFKNMLKIYSKHAILHYNLGLTYAQLGNYSLAQKHFSTSYHLEPKNYLAGLFSAMCLELIGKTNTKLIEDIKMMIGQDDALKAVNFYLTLAHLVENNQFSMNRWLEEDKDKNSPLHLIFDVITAKIINNRAEYLKNAKLLKELLPKDILANIIEFNAKYENEDIKSYARAIQMDFLNRNLDTDGFYYGSGFTKEQYVKFLQMSGLIYKKRKELKEKIQVEQENKVGLMHALAYLDIFTNDFEEAYTLYNSLIDDHNQQDTNTIFLGAVASIGANHPENAIALLELSKLIDPNNLESRYALGLLYHEVKNYKGATTQYAQIGNNGFESKYFDFKIVKN